MLGRGTPLGRRHPLACLGNELLEGISCGDWIADAVSLDDRFAAGLRGCPRGAGSFNISKSLDSGCSDGVGGAASSRLVLLKFPFISCCCLVAGPLRAAYRNVAASKAELVVVVVPVGACFDVCMRCRLPPSPYSRFPLPPSTRIGFSKIYFVGGKLALRE